MITRLVLVDDHPLILDGLERLFGAEDGLKFWPDAVTEKRPWPRSGVGRRTCWFLTSTCRV